MLGHRRLAELETIHKLPYGSFPSAKQVEDRLSAGIAQDLEGGQRAHQREYTLLAI